MVHQDAKILRHYCRAMPIYWMTGKQTYSIQLKFFLCSPQFFLDEQMSQAKDTQPDQKTVHT